MTLPQQHLLHKDATVSERTSADAARQGKRDLRSWAIAVAIVALAAVLRLWGIKHDAQNPFYDAAVHSMGLSWHNFFFGALDPSARLAIDKPPVDLWLQVASTKLLGFNRSALALPEALGGIAAVGLLYAAVTRACGRTAGTLAALGLAVLPIAVLTSRSDTMDSVMSALLVAALWCAVLAVQSRKARYVLLSAAFVGIAFDVKLAQALVPLPAFALLWWAASRPGRRAALAAATTAVLVVVAMAWAFTASLTPLSGRPFPMGSHTGSIYRAMFVFDGIERLTGAAHEPAPYGFASPPGLARLLSAHQPHYATLIGLELLATFALLILAAALWLLDRDRSDARLDDEPAAEDTRHVPAQTYAGTDARPVAGHSEPAPPFARVDAWPPVRDPRPMRDPRTVRRLIAALVMWLATGFVLFSFMGHLQPRYLEAMSPALAALFGIATAGLFARVSLPFAPRLRVLALAVVSLALLAAPAEASIDLIEERTSDANPTGSGSQYSAYLRAHRDGARYEAAAANPLAVVGLIAQDAQPVIVLRSIDGVLLSVYQLSQLVRDGAVRYVILPHPCSSGRHCTPTTAWSVRNSVKIRPGLYRYVAPSRLH
jgi:4-amino-4-deoxy-L-arabinose transferase-like glycosyltransferase